MSVVTVRRGQNLTQLVNRHNKTHRNKVTVGQVAKTNKLKDPNKINVGQRLKVGDGFETPKTRAPSKKPQVKTQPKPTPEKVKTPVQVAPKVAEPAKEARKQGWLEWLVTYKPLG